MAASSVWHLSRELLRTIVMTINDATKAADRVAIEKHLVPCRVRCEQYWISTPYAHPGHLARGRLVDLAQLGM
jgi:hypothetical protein